MSGKRGCRMQNGRCRMPKLRQAVQRQCAHERGNSAEQNFQFKSEFSTWLFRITTNVCITYQTRKKTHDSLDREISASEDETRTLADTLTDNKSTDELTLGSEISKYINKALEELPPQQKMVFTLKYFEEYKIREIAGIMQCSEGAVKKYLFTATHKMRTRLKNIMRDGR